jgi:steroid delta-isomerase-like uncharacterized protein
MKKLFLLGLAITLFIACQNQPQRYFEASAEIETVKIGIKAYEAQDWDTWKSNFADTAKIYHNTNNGVSPADMMSGMKEMISNFSEYKFLNEEAEMEMIVDKDGDTWVNYWNTWGGKAKETGKTVSVPVHLTVQFINGKIVQEYAYYDTAGINAAIAEVQAYNEMPIEEKNILEALDKVVEGWNSHDISNLKSLSVENLVRTSNGAIQTKNINEYEDMMNMFVTGFSNFKVVLDQYDINGNKVYINWTCLGTHDGDFMGNAPTGKKIKTHGFSVWTMDENGKFKSEDAYFDNQVLFNQLGIAPPKE